MNTYQYEKKHLYTQKDRYLARHEHRKMEELVKNLSLGALTNAKLEELKYTVECFCLDIESEQFRRKQEYEPGKTVVV